MSNFNCEKCSLPITENADGTYATGCEHYPLERSTPKTLATVKGVFLMIDIEGTNEQVRDAMTAIFGRGNDD